MKYVMVGASQAGVQCPPKENEVFSRDFMLTVCNFSFTRT